MSQPRSISRAEDYFLPPFPFEMAGFPFDGPTCGTLARRRNSMLRNKLFIDILLEEAGVVNVKAYFPPRDFDALRTLFATYDTNASEESLWKDCITYYLLRWWPDPNSARNFQQKRYMPPEYVRLTAAYFHLDRGDFKTGVNLLCDPRVPTLHSSFVIALLGGTPTKPTYPLVRKYVNMMKPALVQEWEIKIYMSALSLGSLASAWEYQRSFPEGDLRRQLIVTVIEECFLPDPKPHSLRALVAFPFNRYEEKILHDLAREPTRPFNEDPLSITLLHDMVITRLITLGDVDGAIQLESDLPLSPNDEEAAKRAVARRRELISEAKGRDSTSLYAMDIDEDSDVAKRRKDASRHSSRPIRPRLSYARPRNPATPLGSIHAASASLAASTSSSFGAPPPEIQITPNTPLPNRFATPPRRSLVDINTFSRSQGAPSPNTPSTIFNSHPILQPGSPLANIAPRSVSNTRNAFYDPSTLEKPNLWGEFGDQGPIREPFGNSLKRKKSSLSQVHMGEVNGTGEQADAAAETIRSPQDDQDNDSMDEVDRFVVSGAKPQYRLTVSPPPAVDVEPSQGERDVFRFRSEEVQSSKKGSKSSEREKKKGPDQRRGVKRVASNHLELPGSFPRFEPEPSPPDVSPEESMPPLSNSRRKTRQRREEEMRNGAGNNDEQLEMEERDTLKPLDTAKSTAQSHKPARSTRRKRAGSIGSDTSDVSHTQSQSVRRSTRRSVLGSDADGPAPSKEKKTRSRPSSVARSATSTGRKGKSKA